MGKSTINGHFPIATLNYQRVVDVRSNSPSARWSLDIRAACCPPPQKHLLVRRPDLNRELQISLGTAGPQRRALDVR